MTCWFPGTAVLPVGTDADIDADVGTRAGSEIGCWGPTPDLYFYRLA